MICLKPHTVQYIIYLVSTKLLLLNRYKYKADRKHFELLWFCVILL